MEKENKSKSHKITIHTKKILCVFLTLMIFSSYFRISYPDSKSFHQEPIQTIELNNPRTSSIVNFTIEILSVNVTNDTAYRQNDILVHGYAKRANLSIFDWEHASNESIFAVVDDVLNTSITNTTDVNGEFWLVIPIPLSYDINSFMKIQANLSLSNWNVDCLNEFLVDIDAIIRIETLDVGQNPAIPYTSDPSFPNYHIKGRLVMQNNIGYIDPSLTINFTFEDDILTNVPVSFNLDGTFDHWFWLPHGYSYYTLSFDGNSDISSDTKTFALNIQNFTIQILSVNVTNDTAYRQNDILLHGYAERANLLISNWEPASGMDIFAVIDDIRDPLITSITDVNGEFWLIIPIPTSYDIYSSMKIQADLDQSNWNVICLNVTYVDVKANFEIISQDTTQNPAMPYSFDPGFNNYIIQGQLDMDDGTVYSGPGIVLNLRFDDDPFTDVPVNVNPDGTFSHSFWLQEGYSQYTLSYFGDSDLGSSNRIFGLKVIRNVSIIFEETNITAYENREYRFRGTFTSLVNGSVYNLANSGVRLTFLGDYYYTDTDSNGLFQFLLDVPSESSGNSSIIVELEQYDGFLVDPLSINILTLDGSVNITIGIYQPPPPFPPEFIVIIVVGVVGIVGVFLFQRWRLKNADMSDKTKLSKQEIERFRNVKILLDSGRIKEAIAYLYLIYIDLISIKFDIEKKDSMTFRDIAIKLVKEYAQNPQLLYPFMLKIEKVVYGGYPATYQAFENVMPVFEKIFFETTGQNLSFHQVQKNL